MRSLKHSVVCIVILLLSACDSDSAWDCVQSPGTGVVFEEPVEEFHSITIQGHMDLVLIQDTLTQVKVETRENLATNIHFSVLDGLLFIEEASSCNIFKDRSYTTVYIHAPKLLSIRNASTGAVRNEGVWVQDKIALISENYFDSAYYNSGTFDMHLELGELSVLANGNSLFQLKGTAEKADISFYSGSARLEAKTMQIQEIDLYHRGYNHLMVYPVQAIRGEILNTGDVRAYNQPPIVEVEEKYKGSLIFVE